METERAWAAGFFDGEGGSYHDKKMGTCLQLAQAGDHAQVLLTRFQQAVGGLGKIRTNRIYPGRKPSWTWFVSSFERAQQGICYLWPYLGPAKRAQWKAVATAWQARPKRGAINQWNMKETS